MGRKLFRIFLIMVPAAVVILMAFCVYGWPGKDKGEIKHTFSKEEASREILFEGDHIFTTKDSFIQIEATTVTITRSGTYMLKGRLNNGQIIINVGKDEEVKLKLNGVSLSCDYGPPIYVKQAKGVKLRLKSGSENELADVESPDIINTSTDDDKQGGSKNDADSDNEAENETGSGEEEDSWRGCIYARSDLNIKGDGELTVHGNHRHGIFSSKDLKIKSGNITVEAARQALHGRKSVIIEDGKISLKAGTDGIHSNGTLDIIGGTVDIDAGKYGMYAFTRLRVYKLSADKTEKDTGSDAAEATDIKKGARVTVQHALSEAGCQGEMEY